MSKLMYRVPRHRTLSMLDRLLQENRNPTEDEIRFGISGNLCRCTGYQNIVKAIQYAAAKLGAASLQEAAQ